MKTENDMKTEGVEDSKTEDAKTEGEKGPTTLKSSNALAALVQVTVAGVSTFDPRDGFIWHFRCLSLNLIDNRHLMQVFLCVQLFLEREQAAVVAEAQTDDLISEAPKSQADQSGEWKETSGEIQWVASENNDDDTNDKKEEEEEELDLNKGSNYSLMY